MERYVALNKFYNVRQFIIYVHLLVVVVVQFTRISHLFRSDNKGFIAVMRLSYERNCFNLLQDLFLILFNSLYLLCMIFCFYRLLLCSIS